MGTSELATSDWYNSDLSPLHFSQQMRKQMSAHPLLIAFFFFITVFSGGHYHA